MKTPACLLVLLGILAAVTPSFSQWPGHVNVVGNPGEREIRITPGWLKGTNSLAPTPRLGGRWTDKTPNNFTLDAVLLGGVVPEKLTLDIDGKATEFSARTGPDSGYTSHNKDLKMVEITRRFEVPLTVVEQMVAAKKVVVRMGDGNTFADSVFSSDENGRARPAFKKALQTITTGIAPAAPKTSSGVATRVR